MNHHYKDIRDKLGPPRWFDEAAVPRYCEFSPHVTHNIYAREVALVKIACQSCGHIFQVAMSWPSNFLLQPEDSLEKRVEESSLWYVDPPNVECCPAGPTMTSITHRVLQFWRHSFRADKWSRVPELERDMYDPSVWERGDDDDGV
jgi:hypothetical protein